MEESCCKRTKKKKNVLEKNKKLKEENKKLKEENKRLKKILREYVSESEEESSDNILNETIWSILSISPKK